MVGWRGTGLVLAGMIVLLAGCGGSPKKSAASPPTTSAPITDAPASASPSTTDSATPSASAQAASSGCRTSHLKVTLGQADGAAGSTNIPILFTNTAATTCTMYGYPGVSFVTGDSGQQVGSPANRTGTTPKTVTLAPGRSAHANLRTLQVGNFDQAQCKPVTVRGFRVYPPNETAAVFLPEQTQACSAPGIGVPDVQPVQPGAA